MQDQGSTYNNRLPGLGGTKRKAINFSSKDPLLKFEQMSSERATPLLVRPLFEDVNLMNQAIAHREAIRRKLIEHKALLFRGFNLQEVADFEQLIKNLAGELLEYSYRSTPRSKVEGNIYTSTDYPANQHIPLHNEMSYSRRWPMIVGFFCLIAAKEGGETPIADSQNVYERISPRVREKFTQKQVMYVRNYGEGLDLSWQSVFQTTDRAEVERFCQASGIDWEWKSNDGLRTRQVCQAVATHPTTGQVVWFNQAHLFHVSGLPQEVLETLQATHREEDFPRNACYGDGSPIEMADLQEIREAYRQEYIAFPWQKGDILLLDNMLMAHGRTPYKPERKIVVGMAEPFEVNS